MTSKEKLELLRDKVKQADLLIEEARIIADHIRYDYSVTIDGYVEVTAYKINE